MQLRRKKKAAEYRIERRWTEKIASEGFTPVASAFLSNYAALQPPLTPVEAMLIVHLISFKWDREAPWPSLRTLAKLMGRSERYIRKMCETLEGVGYVKRVERDGRTNQFDLSGLFQKLEEKISASVGIAPSAPHRPLELGPTPIPTQPDRTKAALIEFRERQIVTAQAELAALRRLP